MEDDTELRQAIVGVASDDDAARNAGVIRIRPLIRAALRKFQSKNRYVWTPIYSIDDAEQSAMIRIVLAAKTYDVSRPPIPYLQQVVTNSILNDLKLASFAKRRPTGGKRAIHLSVVDHLDAGNMLVAVNADPETRIDRANLLRAFFEAMKSFLTEKEYAALISVAEGQSYEEAVERYGFPNAKSVDNARVGAKAKCICLLSEVDLDRSAEDVLAECIGILRSNLYAKRYSTIAGQTADPIAKKTRAQ